MHIYEITSNLRYSIFINSKVSCVLCKLYLHPPASSSKQTLIGFLSLWLVWPVLELQTNSHTVWTLFCLFFFIQHNGFYICVTVCTLAWKLSWTEEPGRLESMGSLRVRHDWGISLLLFTFMHWRRKWKPTPVFLSEESQGWRSLMGYRLWCRTELDTTEVT